MLTEYHHDGHTTQVGYIGCKLVAGSWTCLPLTAGAPLLVSGNSRGFSLLAFVRIALIARRGRAARRRPAQWRHWSRQVLSMPSPLASLVTFREVNGSRGDVVIARAFTSALQPVEGSVCAPWG